MTVVDLTHRIEPGMTVFPGTPQPILEKPYTVEKHGFAETMLHLMSHTGTHIDAPAHMLASGPTLDQLHADRFVGRAYCLPAQGAPVLDLAVLQPHTPFLERSDFLLFATGWDRHWGTQAYYTHFPVLTDEAARWLLQFKFKAVGADTLSFDRHDSVTFPVHHILMQSGHFLIENLKNLTPLACTEFTLVAAPLYYAQADGAPARVLAIIP